MEECRFGCGQSWAWCWVINPCEGQEQEQEWFLVQQAWEELQAN